MIINKLKWFSTLCVFFWWMNYGVRRSEIGDGYVLLLFLFYLLTLPVWKIESFAQKYHIFKMYKNNIKYTKVWRLSVGFSLLSVGYFLCTKMLRFGKWKFPFKVQINFEQYSQRVETKGKTRRFSYWFFTYGKLNVFNENVRLRLCFKYWEIK